MIFVYLAFFEYFVHWSNYHIKDRLNWRWRNYQVGFLKSFLEQLMVLWDSTQLSLIIFAEFLTAVVVFCVVERHFLDEKPQ